MDYEYQTQDQLDDVHAAAILMREQEHAEYGKNIQVYQHWIDTLGTAPALPANLKQHLSADGEKLATAGLSGGDVEAVIAQRHLLWAKAMINSERIQQAKSEFYLAAHRHYLPAGPQRDAAMARVKAKQQDGAAANVGQAFAKWLRNQAV